MQPCRLVWMIHINLRSTLFDNTFKRDISMRLKSTAFAVLLAVAFCQIGCKGTPDPEQGSSMGRFMPQEGVYQIHISSDVTPYQTGTSAGPDPISIAKSHITSYSEVENVQSDILDIRSCENERKTVLVAEIKEEVISSFGNDAEMQGCVSREWRESSSALELDIDCTAVGLGHSSWSMSYLNGGPLPIAEIQLNGSKAFMFEDHEHYCGTFTTYEPSDAAYADQFPERDKAAYSTVKYSINIPDAPTPLQVVFTFPSLFELGFYEWAPAVTPGSNDRFGFKILSDLPLFAEHIGTTGTLDLSQNSGIVEWTFEHTLTDDNFVEGRIAFPAPGLSIYYN